MMTMSMNEDGHHHDEIHHHHHHHHVDEQHHCCIHILVSNGVVIFICNTLWVDICFDLISSQWSRVLMLPDHKI
jgi:hypothetical protein